MFTIFVAGPNNIRTSFLMKHSFISQLPCSVLIRRVYKRQDLAKAASEIRAAISSADCCVFLLTEYNINVAMELGIAYAFQKKCMVFCDDLALAGFLSESVELRATRDLLDPGKVMDLVDECLGRPIRAVHVGHEASRGAR